MGRQQSAREKSGGETHVPPELNGTQRLLRGTWNDILLHLGCKTGSCGIFRGKAAGTLKTLRPREVK